MLRVVSITDSENIGHNILLCDADNGHDVRSIVEFPDVYSTFMEQNPGVSLFLVKLEGSIGSYKTACYGLEVEGEYIPDDVTALLSQLLTIPETAAKAIIANYPEEMQTAANNAVAAVKYCEELSPGVKLCLPKEAFSRLPSEVVQEMSSVRSSYVLKNTDNQEIFQTSYDAPFGILLPDLDAIHSTNGDLLSALDILRVVAPYRTKTGRDAYSYSSIYHTPYYKVDPRLMGMVPSQFASWIDGYSSNDTLDIQPNEQHMVSNLKTLICADVSRYVREMVSGIFFDTPLGSMISRFCDKRDAEVTQQLCQDIKERGNDDVRCDISFSDVDELYKAGWYQSDVVRTVKKSIVMGESYLHDLIVNRPRDRRTIECGNLPFSLDLTDEQEQEFTELLIEQGYISSSMQRFLIDLCKRAYEVNWGHTGAAKSIPGFVDRGAVEYLNQSIGEYTTDCMAKELPDMAKYPALYLQGDSSNDDDEDSIFDVGGDSSPRDELTSHFDYYVTVETAQKIDAGTLPDDYFSTPASAAQTTEASIVEYWRNVNGENNLESFLSMAFIKTSDVNVFSECLIKLMRWGERKPKTLVLQKHPEVRNIFDLGKGMIVDNTVIVDESTLVKVNGCEYTFAFPIVSASNTNGGLHQEYIIGFGLQKDYGNVKKLYLASWLDLGEMLEEDAINIADFLTITKLDLNMQSCKVIEPLAKEKYEFYVSDSNIDEAFRLKVQAKELSALALLVNPGVMESVEYLRSLKNEELITLKDRQYDFLRRYTDTLNRFYAVHANDVKAVTNSIEFRELIAAFFAMFKSGPTAKVDANTARAASTVQTLNLEGVTTKEVKWDTSPLEGKFRIIYDVDMKAALPPIEFFDANMKAISAKLRNRVVLLLLQTDKKFIFCRKEIGVNEVLVLTGKDAQGVEKRRIASQAYTVFDDAFQHLLKGETRTIKGVPVVLHESLKDFV